MDEKEVVSLIKKYFSIETTEALARRVNLSTSTLRRIAKKHNIVKSPKYINNLKNKLIQNRKEWYNAKITYPIKSTGTIDIGKCTRGWLLEPKEVLIVIIKSIFPQLSFIIANGNFHIQKTLAFIFQETI